MVPGVWDAHYMNTGTIRRLRHGHDTTQHIRGHSSTDRGEGSSQDEDQRLMYRKEGLVQEG